MQPKHIEETEEEAAPSSSTYLITGGAELLVTPSEASPTITVESGARLALSGKDTYRKHFFCDWLLGFVAVAGSRVEVRIGEQTISDPKELASMAAVLGRSPLLYGETIQESLLYRTHDVRKQDLFHLIERLYGPSLKNRTSAQNPLLDENGKPVPTSILTAREHLEVAQINVLLQKTPVVILDLSSELMNEAIAEGFRPCQELLGSGKTLIVILPPDKDKAWGEQILGCPFSSCLKFDV